MRNALWVALVVLVVAPAAGADEAVAVAPAFTLDLEHLDLAAPGAFHLVPGGLTAPDDAAPAAADPPPAAPGLALTLAWTPDDERVPDGLRMSFKQRTWEDLSPWEKTGYVLAQTSAAAGLAYLLYRVVN